MNILRFITAGSVDDGKSTLIGRLLYDSNAVMEDQLEAIKASSRKNDDGTIDLAILTDGLKAEREQGITIDVAYKYFNTDKRKFIIADAPGHIQYTRNMVTGASNVDLAIILIDARKGVIEQTKRHSYITSLLGIKNIVVCINKMDLVGYSEQVFNDIVSAYKSFASKLKVKEIIFIPISAINGDNIVSGSTHMPWYKGKYLLDYLENVEVFTDAKQESPRFTVQWIIRPQTRELHDYRGYAGRIISGVYKKGDKIIVQPSCITSTIKKIETFDGEFEEAFAPMSVTIHLEDNIDISRGDMITPVSQQPPVTREIEADICWMDSKPLEVGSKYLFRHNSSGVKSIVKEVLYKTNVNTLEKVENDITVNLNDISRIIIRTANPVAVDEYDKNRVNGGFILVDEKSNLTVAAGMIAANVE
ncbi:MAG: GTP-binding protein [Bacteroidetes bacterium]|nr:GTP-binding protein [Bacteroidota bacterium]